MEKANRAKTELGKILGVDRTTIGFYEEGKRRPSIKYLYRFCEHFRISMDGFISKCNQLLSMKMYDKTLKDGY